MGALEQSFLEFLKQKDFSCTFKQLLSQMIKQSGQMRKIKLSLRKMIQRYQEVFIKLNKSI